MDKSPRKLRRAKSTMGPMGDKSPSEKRFLRIPRKGQKIPKEVLESDQWLSYFVVKGEWDATMLKKWAVSIEMADTAGQFRAALTMIHRHTNYDWVVSGWQLYHNDLLALDDWAERMKIRFTVYVPRPIESINAGEDGSQEGHYAKFGYLMAVWDAPHNIEAQARQHDPTDITQKFHEWDTTRHLAQACAQLSCKLMPVVRGEDYSTTEGEDGKPDTHRLTARFDPAYEWAMKRSVHLYVYVPENPWTHSFMFDRPIMSSWGWLMADWAIPFNISQPAPAPVSMTDLDLLPEEESK